jgi:tRNA-2-methylthio-N6-dimethylallyladenosine synthase
MKYIIKTFGCAQNVADSERVASAFEGRGMTETDSYKDANYVVINTCMVRQSAENRVYGLVENLAKLKEEKLARKEVFKIIVTGCMVGVAFRDKSGQYLAKIRRVMPEVDEFMPIEEVGFDNEPVRTTKEIAWVPISNGCNNFCTFCIVPFTRGREISRPFEDILQECMHLRLKGYKNIQLLGQNVNSYGADLIVGEKNIQVMRDIDKKYFETDLNAVHNDSGKKTIDKTITYSIKGKELKPVFVKHLGRYRIPTLFPHLLEEVAKLGFEKVDFMSSNPWDFSDELIDVIAKNKNITRTFHIAVQSGDNNVLKRMNRWYTAEDFVALTEKMREKIPGAVFTTDIIVGFCGETDAEFKNTLALVKKVGFQKAYISRYSQRPMTAATKVFADNVPAAVKKSRWEELDAVINKPHLHKKN